MSLFSTWVWSIVRLLNLSYFKRSHVFNFRADETTVCQLLRNAHYHFSLSVCVCVCVGRGERGLKSPQPLSLRGACVSDFDKEKKQAQPFSRFLQKRSSLRSQISSRAYRDIQLFKYYEINLGNIVHGRSTLLGKFQIFQKMAILTLHYFVQKSFRQPVEDPKVCFAILYIKAHLIYKILKLRILWKWKWCKAYLASFDISMLLSRGLFGQSLHSLDQI